jgi:hypothetical protein
MRRKYRSPIDDFEKLLDRVTGTRYFSFVVFAAAAGCRRREHWH